MTPEQCLACGFDPTLRTELVADFTVDMNYPSQNALGANSRGNAGYHYRKIRADFASKLYEALTRAKVPKAILKRRVWLTRLWGPRKRAYDVANLVGGGKAIVDCLVNRGLLVDDSPRWYEGIYSQRAGSSDQILIRIEDILP